MRAKSAKIAVWTAKDIDAVPKDLGLSGSPTNVVRIFTPPHRTGGQVITGETGEIVDKVAGLLKEVITG
ncbi:MAG: electron transfer flavoprotein subunit beta, partial [Candidatus Omnitrophica bacterium]|nr:electron transfer flavoprotein subunit beta [Candidatus Omnitrophota bacterium]